MQAGTNDSLTLLCNPDRMVVIGVKESMITAKNSVRIRTRNYAVQKLLKKGCRESPPCDDSESDGAFEPDAVKIDRSCEPPQGPEQSRAGSGGDTVSTDRSSESRQGHEQPGANSDTAEYESRQKSGHPGSERDTDRGHAFWDRPSRKTRSTKNTKYSEKRTFACLL